MFRSVARRALRAVRRFNREWIDRLDPPEPSAAPAEDPQGTMEPPVPAPDPRPSAVAAAPSTAEPAVQNSAPPAATIEIWAESTPNPDAMKFSAAIPISPRGSLSFDSAEAAAEHPLGRALFAIEGVQSIFAVNDFVTITRAPGTDWDLLAPKVERALADALA